jgi:hypothetical protein
LVSEWLDNAIPSRCESRRRQRGRLLTGRPQGCIVTGELVAYYALCDQSVSGGPEMSGKIVRLQQAKKYRIATSKSKGRQRNGAYRVREHPTEVEMDKLLATLKGNRHSQRTLAGHKKEPRTVYGSGVRTGCCLSL